MDRTGYFTTLVNFSGFGNTQTPPTPTGGGADVGATPLAPLTLGTDGKLYGTASQGGIDNAGTVFRVSISGVIEQLHWFRLIEAMHPKGKVVQGADGNFYLQTFDSDGPQLGQTVGAIVRVTPNGTRPPNGTPGGEVVLNYANFLNATDGQYPSTGLAQGREGNFYGVTFAGGMNGLGTVFKVTPSGGRTTLYSFDGEANGSNPQGELIEHPSTTGLFYGVTSNGGAFGYGTVYSIDRRPPPQTLRSLGHSDHFLAPRMEQTLTPASFSARMMVFFTERHSKAAQMVTERSSG